MGRTMWMCDGSSTLGRAGRPLHADAQRNRDKLLAVSNRLVNLSKQVRDRNQQIRAASGQPLAGSEITELEYRGQKIFFFNFIGLTFSPRSLQIAADPNRKKETSEPIVDPSSAN